MSNSSNKKYITQDVIDERLKKAGVPDCSCDLNEDDLYKKLSDHFDFEVTDNWPRHAEFYCYTETTQDGYEVWVATPDCDRVHVCEHVYYYDNDLSEVLSDAMRDGGLIYVDDLEADYYEEALERLFDEFIEDKITEITEELIEEGYEPEDDKQEEE
jgi:hypothetical protein